MNAGEMNAGDTPRSNPFSTRFIRPGSLPYRFTGFPGSAGKGSSVAEATSDIAAQLVARLARAGWRGQIVGPHGTGKSTLLATLEPALTTAGRRCVILRLHDGQRRLPHGWFQQVRAAEPRSPSVHAPATPLVIVDGYEQLSGWSRFQLKLACRIFGYGLLVTSHAEVGLPTLFETGSDLETAQELVRVLQQDDPVHIAPEVVAEHYLAAGGNLREMLFRLYDVWEQAARRQR